MASPSSSNARGLGRVDDGVSIIAGLTVIGVGVLPVIGGGVPSSADIGIDKTVIDGGVSIGVACLTVIGGGVPNMSSAP